MSPLLRELLAPEFGRLCEQWQVPELAEKLYDATYLDISPPSLLPEGNQIRKRIQPMRPAVGEIVPGERLPDTFAALPYADTVYLTLGTVFHQAPGVFDAALAGLRELPFNVVATIGPHSDPARFGPQPPNVVIEPFIPQALVLAQCCLVVSHGGADTMFGAWGTAYHNCCCHWAPISSGTRSCPPGGLRPESQRPLNVALPGP